MKVEYVGLARSVWLFDTNSMNPTGRSLQDVLEKLGAKYKFGKAPKNTLDLDDQKAWSFQGGTFVNAEGTALSISLSVYSDGISADTQSSTDDSTYFLVELKRWLKIEFGLVIPEVNKAYLSQLHVQCATPLSSLNPRLSKFAKLLDSFLVPDMSRRSAFDVSALGLWSEDIDRGTPASIFRFERRIGKPFTSNQYFSQAPIETHQHVELLDTLQLILDDLPV